MSCDHQKSPAICHLCPLSLFAPHPQSVPFLVYHEFCLGCGSHWLHCIAYAVFSAHPNFRVLKTRDGLLNKKRDLTIEQKGSPGSVNIRLQAGELERKEDRKWCVVTLKPLLVLRLDTHTLVAVIIKVNDLDVCKPCTDTASCDHATPPRNPGNHLLCLYLTWCLDLSSPYFIHS